MEKLNSSKILVFGLPGSGKTTFARQLAVNMAYFNADEIRKCLTTGIFLWKVDCVKQNECIV